MKNSSQSISVSGQRRRRRALTPLLAGMLAVAGCAGLSPPGGETDPAVTIAEQGVSGEGMGAVLDYHSLVATMGSTELAQERTALSNARGTPLLLVRQAILLSHPEGAVNIPRALALLGAVAAQRTPDAIALHPLVRLLSDQLRERQRLDETASRLTQQLERVAQQLKDSQRRGEQLQEKLDALTEIERSLPTRPAATPSPPLPTPPRRLSR